MKKKTWTRRTWNLHTERLQLRLEPGPSRCESRVLITNTPHSLYCALICIYLILFKCTQIKQFCVARSWVSLFIWSWFTEHTAVRIPSILRVSRQAMEYALTGDSISLLRDFKAHGDNDQVRGIPKRFADYVVLLATSSQDLRCV